MFTNGKRTSSTTAAISVVLPSDMNAEATMTTSDQRPYILLKLLRYVLLDILKNRMVLLYTVFLFAVSFGILTMSGDPLKGIASLLNILLLVTPLLSIIFPTIYYYNAAEFTELLAAQPVKRKSILISQYLGLSISLILSLLIGAGLPIFFLAPGTEGISLLMAMAALTLVFVSLAMLSAQLTRDKARGIGLSILLWFYFTLLYDAIMLMIMFAYIDYPMESLTLIMVSLNPIDLARTIVLLQLDVSALMGYTGALMLEIMGSSTGIIAATGIMLLWAILPFAIALRRFNKRDF